MHQVFLDILDRDIGGYYVSLQGHRWPSGVSIMTLVISVISTGTGDHHLSLARHWCPSSVSTGTLVVIGCLYRDTCCGHQVFYSGTVVVAISCLCRDTGVHQMSLRGHWWPSGLLECKLVCPCWEIFIKYLLE